MAAASSARAPSSNPAVFVDADGGGGGGVGGGGGAADKLCVKDEDSLTGINAVAMSGLLLALLSSGAPGPMGLKAPARSLILNNVLGLLV